jgi:hypothetical protein
MSDTATPRLAMGTRTLSAIGVGLMAAAGRSMPRPQAKPAPAPTTPALVAAAPLSPAEEIERLLRRAESLMLNELRWDDKVRSECYGLALRVASLTTDVAPRNPPVISDWPAPSA